MESIFITLWYIRSVSTISENRDVSSIKQIDWLPEQCALLELFQNSAIVIHGTFTKQANGLQHRINNVDTSQIEQTEIWLLINMASFEWKVPDKTLQINKYGIKNNI